MTEGAWCWLFAGGFMLVLSGIAQAAWIMTDSEDEPYDA
jgi:hypothetical protein